MYLQVFTTLPTKQQANQLAKLLVKAKLAACVQVIGPINSVYRWQEKIEQTKEWLCLIKTKQSLYLKVEKFITQHHPYAVPEIITISIKNGNTTYLRWLNDSTIL